MGRNHVIVFDTQVSELMETCYFYSLLGRKRLNCRSRKEKGPAREPAHRRGAVLGIERTLMIFFSTGGV